MRGLAMEIKKKDYTRVYDLILAELEADVYGAMVEMILILVTKLHILQRVAM